MFSKKNLAGNGGFKPIPPHRTKIICTLGPSSDDLEVIEGMIEAGMNIARLNFSHGDFSYHGSLIERIRMASRRKGRQIAIMADLPGPKIRIGDFEEEPVTLKKGDLFTLTTEKVRGSARRVSVPLPALTGAVKKGDSFSLNEGLIHLTVTEVKGKDVECRVLEGGEITSRKGINLPGIDLGLKTFTDRDRECLAFALERGVDAVSQSFVKKRQDIEDLRMEAARRGHDPFVIAKIERASALDHLDEIISSADGIMIARGDLGVEIPLEKIALVQKMITAKTIAAGKPVITATQMLESMTEQRRPTRAEATDVANAILDGTDCLMLSGESAVGMYPLESVEMLCKIARVTEPERPLTPPEFHKGEENGKEDPVDTISGCVYLAQNGIDSAAVIVPTRSGRTARRIARFRLPVWVMAVSPREETCQALQFSYGVHPILEHHHPEDWNQYASRLVSGYDLQGKFVILTEGPSPAHPGGNNRMEIIDIKVRERKTP